MAKRGDVKERKVRDVLISEGWVLIRAAGSLGPADLVAMRRAGMILDDDGAALTVSEVRHIEVKGTADGPYKNFSRADRIEMKEYAEKAGASAWLAWWPPRKQLKWIPSREWPPDR